MRIEFVLVSEHSGKENACVRDLHCTCSSSKCRTLWLCAVPVEKQNQAVEMTRSAHSLHSFTVAICLLLTYISVVYMETLRAIPILKYTIETCRVVNNVNAFVTCSSPALAREAKRVHLQG